MRSEEKVAYLKALMSIALADDKVGDNELEYFNRLGDMYGLSKAELEDIKDTVISKKESIESILTGITERQTKLMLLYELIALCYADGNYSLAEQTGLKEICNLLNVESGKLKEIESVMEESVSLQRKINVVLERGER